jgi:hypothetical protein
MAHTLQLIALLAATTVGRVCCLPRSVVGCSRCCPNVLSHRTLVTLEPVPDVGAAIIQSRDSFGVSREVGRWMLRFLRYLGDKRSHWHHHVNSYYANLFDAERQRRSEAEKRVRREERLEAICAWCNIAFNDAEKRVRAAGRYTMKHDVSRSSTSFAPVSAVMQSAFHHQRYEQSQTRRRRRQELKSRRYWAILFHRRRRCHENHREIHDRTPNQNCLAREPRLGVDTRCCSCSPKDRKGDRPDLAGRSSGNFLWGEERTDPHSRGLGKEVRVTSKLNCGRRRLTS